jgi:ubiquinol-cytochrome c reductase cytochrome c subunit
MGLLSGAPGHGRAKRPRPPVVVALLLPAAVAAVGFWPGRPVAAQVTGPAAADAAKDLYLSDCGVCHGDDGHGTNRGPTLVGVGRASLDYQLTTGRMPIAPVGRAPEPGDPLRPLPNQGVPELDEPVKRHAPAYPPETVAALVDYVHRLAGGGGPDIPRVTGAGGDLAEGGKLFRLQCAACHAWAGDGGALLHVDAPSLHSSTPTQIAEAIRLGPGQMPAFGDAALTDEQTASVVAYVSHLNDVSDRGGRPLWHLGPVAEGGLALLALAGLMVFLRWIGERG